MSSFKICALGASMLVAPSIAAAAEAPKGPVTNITLEFDVRHDSNVARGSAQRAAQRGLVRSDERFTPTLDVELARPVGPHLFSINGNLGYDFYRRNGRLNRERLEIAGGADLHLSRCELNLTPSFSRKQSDLGDISALSTGGGGSVRNAETIQDYEGTLSCGGAFGLRPTANAGRTIGDNSAIRRRISDYRTTTYGGGLTYVGPAVGTVSAIYRHAINDYPHRNLPGGASDGYTTDGVTFSLERSIGSRLTGQASLGYLSLSPRRAATQSFSSATWNVGLTGTIGTSLQLHGATSRSVMPSLLNDSLYHVSRSFELDATYAINTRMSFKLGGSTATRRYVGAGAAFGPLLTSDRRDEVNATFSLRQSPRLSFFLDGGYETRHANDNFYNYDNVYVGLRTQFRLY